MNNVSFKSTINYVNNFAYRRRVNGIYFNCSNEPFGDCYVKNGFIWTDKVRTCTGIVLADTRKKEALGIHWLDSKEHYRYLEAAVNQIFQKFKTPNRCFIIGGKELGESEFSIPSLDKFIKTMSERVQSVTVFGKHLNQYDESNIHYNVFEDVLTLSTSNALNFESSVFDIETLKKTFGIIKIAKGDKLYINGKLIMKSQIKKLTNKAFII